MNSINVMNITPGLLKEKNTNHTKNRCAACRKRVGLAGFDCRCGKLYCSLHRYSDQHGCTFDYKAWGAEEIARRNPRIIAEKIRKL